ncbi:hypothetical protein NQD34_001563 [Periophthalmus magnuspinnatus]|nr:hypothetical protein NQD34_001563 [Periophthalmus magnuspinnatus]
MEDGGKAAGRKPCCVTNRRTIICLIFLCSFVILYGFNMSETSNTWTGHLWSHYVNTTSQMKLSNSALKQLILSLNNKRTTTNMTTSTPPSSEYKSPGPYLVEYPHKYNFIINQPTKCEELKPFLVLVVPVAPQNIEDRKIIRDTWGAREVLSNKNVTLFFLLGLGEINENELLEESKHHKDIIQSDFVDCYKNLTIKTMVMLEWLDTYCHQASYAMKIDSDMFLNVPKLIEMLEHAPKTNYLSGLVEWAASVHRHTTSKWFVPFEIFSRTTFPPYALGLGYVLSLNLPKKLLEASREVKALYIEDVYLGMCMHHLGLSPTDPLIQGAFHVFPLYYNRCQYSKIIATTLDTHTNRRQLWADFTKPGPYC